MLSRIISALSPRKKTHIRLERREPVLALAEDDGFEAQLEREFAHSSPTAALNPAYIQAMTQATRS